MNLRLQPEDRTSSYVEIWVPGSASEIHLQVRPPGGDTLEHHYTGLVPTDYESQRFQLHASNILADQNSGNVLCRASLDEPNIRESENVSGDPLWWRVLIAFAPTKVLNNRRLPAPHGLWNINIQSNQNASPTHAWIQRDVTMPGFGRRGRQPYFEDPAYENARFDELGDVSIDDETPATSVITRNGTLSGLAISKELMVEKSIKEPDGNNANSHLDTIVVGASRWDTCAATLFSGAGLLSSPSTIQPPTAMAPSQTSRTLPNILSAGSRNGSRTAQSGTSFSAPQIAQLLADQIAQQSIDERIDFDGKSVLSELGQKPSRPTDKEIATRSPVRQERLSEHGKLHVPAPQSEAGFSRGTRSKRP